MSKKLIITKNNYLDYLYPTASASASAFTSASAAETFVKNLKKFCKIAPEFTHEPQLQIKETLYDGTRFIYVSHYSYGKFVAYLKCKFFCFNKEKIRNYETLIFDLKSFGIKRATQGKIDKICGISPPRYDLENKLSNETRILIEEYIKCKRKIEKESI